MFSVPFDSGYTSKTNATLVTAAHAVFIDHRGHNKAPAAVVGLQYQHDSLARHFKNITSACTGTGHCRKTCASDELDCYVLDNNGFVILSESTEHTGKFFGQIDGTIMDSLVQDRIYRRVSLMNYQGLCSDRENPYTAAGDVTARPLRQFSWFFKYIVSFATTWISLFPNPVHSWSHYSEQYVERNFGDDSEDSSYPEEYDEEMGTQIDAAEQTTEHNVSDWLFNQFLKNYVNFEFFFSFSERSRRKNLQCAQSDCNLNDTNHKSSARFFIHSTVRFENRFVCSSTGTIKYKHTIERQINQLPFIRM